MALCSTDTGMPQSPVSHCLMEHMLGSSMAEITHSASASNDPYFPLPPDVDEEWADDGDDEPVPVLKQCMQCKKYKPMDDFAKDESRKDKKQKRCRACHRDRRKQASERGKEKGHVTEEDGNPTQDEEPPQKRSTGSDDEDGETVVQESVEGPSRKRIKSKGDVIKFIGEDLYVLKNSRLPEYKIGCSGDITARSNGLQRSQNFYILKVAIFEGKGHLEDTVREMLRYCLLSREVAAGEEWHTCSLQVALAAIGQAIENDNAQR